MPIASSSWAYSRDLNAHLAEMLRLAYANVRVLSPPIADPPLCVFSTYVILSQPNDTAALEAMGEQVRSSTWPCYARGRAHFARLQELAHERTLNGEVEISREELLMDQSDVQLLANMHYSLVRSH